MRTLILLALTSTLLAACGVKGPLYLPEKRYPQPQTPAQPQQQSPKTEEPLLQTEPSALDSQPLQEAP